MIGGDKAQERDPVESRLDQWLEWQAAVDGLSGNRCAYRMIKWEQRGEENTILNTSSWEMVKASAYIAMDRRFKTWVGHQGKVTKYNNVEIKSS